MLAVLGAAGSGKTTLARHTALEMAARRWPVQRRRWWRRRSIPVLLYLRDHAEAILTDQPPGLAQIAVTARWLDGVIPAEWVEQRLERGQCVILLDGLDEVAAPPRDRSRVVQWVEAQISRYPGNTFVITSRPQGYDTNRLTRADVLQVQRFTNQQIHAFLHAWYRAIEHRARQGDPQEIDRIAAQAANDLFHRISDRPALYDLAANPLLLTMIAKVHRYRGSLPDSRAALYEEVCQVLLHCRQEAKNLTGTGFEDLGGDKKERIIQELALYMMRHRQGDIPVEEAQRAIRPILERTAPALTPEGFLTQTRRTGLLLEHQYGHYGFAHLTLQEYLAAALIPGHASRRQLLIDNVKNPWWRETTLLWAARANASPVVQACLAARTVTALNLAYACAAEACELDSALRGQLDQLLTTTPTDPEEMRLLDGVAAARALQDTHALDDEGTRICDPIPDDLRNRYATRTGRPHPFDPAGAAWTTADFKAFLTWLNSLFTNGTSYRLPTPAEARHALSSGLYPTFRTPILYAADDDWADDHGQARVISPDPGLHPHRPTAQQISAYPDLILDHTHLIFRLCFPQSALTFSHLLPYARSRHLTRPERRLLLTLDRARHRSLASYLDVDSPVNDLARELNRARGLTQNRDHTRARVLEFIRVLDSVRDGHPDDLTRALGHALELIRARHHDLACAEDLAPGDAPALALDRVRTLDLDRALDRALDRDLPGIGDFARDSAPGYALALVHADAPSDATLALARALLHPCPRDRGRLDDAIDFAFARAAANSGLALLDASAVMVLRRACLHLLRGLGRSGNLDCATRRRQRRGGQGPSLTQFLHGELEAVTTWAPANDPAVALKHALHLAQTLGRTDMAAQIKNALRLWNPRHLQQCKVVLAATSVLAALAHSEETTPELSQNLRAALCALIALTPTIDTDPEDTTTQAKLPILVRN